jgi:hypothetical protein
LTPGERACCARGGDLVTWAAEVNIAGAAIAELNVASVGRSARRSRLVGRVIACDAQRRMTDLKRRRWTWEEVQTAALEEDGSVRYVPTRRLRCKPGEFPWDEWQLRACAAGVPEALASLGRGVIREAYQHTWSAALQSECGWDDDGESMIDLALRDAAGAARRWSWLLETDAGRARAH